MASLCWEGRYTVYTVMDSQPGADSPPLLTDSWPPSVEWPPNATCQPEAGQCYTSATADVSGTTVQVGCWPAPESGELGFSGTQVGHSISY